MRHPIYEEPQHELTVSLSKKNHQLEGLRATCDGTSRPSHLQTGDRRCPSQPSVNLSPRSLSHAHSAFPLFGFRNLAHWRFLDHGDSLCAQASPRPAMPLPAGNTACVCMAAQASRARMRSGYQPSYKLADRIDRLPSTSCRDWHSLLEAQCGLLLIIVLWDEVDYHPPGLSRPPFIAVLPL